MREVWKGIEEAVAAGKRLLAVLIDPDKFDLETAEDFLRKIPAGTTHLFVGGSYVKPGKTDDAVIAIKKWSHLPVVLFPGDHSQITDAADALLFLSLISGRNPEFLIEQQVKSVEKLRKNSLEIIPTGYILIDGENLSSVEKVSQTIPLCQEQPQMIIDTALAGKYSGKKLIYLEAGSGAKKPVLPKIISAVKEAVQLPLLVGGGIRSEEQLQSAYQAGANMLVIGTAFEDNTFDFRESTAKFPNH